MPVIVIITLAFLLILREVMRGQKKSDFNTTNLFEISSDFMQLYFNKN